MKPYPFINTGIIVFSFLTAFFLFFWLFDMTWVNFIIFAICSFFQWIFIVLENAHIDIIDSIEETEYGDMINGISFWMVVQHAWSRFIKSIRSNQFFS